MNSLIKSSMAQIKIFLVENDPWFGESLKQHLSLNSEYQLILFKTASDCLSNLHLKPDVISVDYNLPDMDGDLFLKKIQEHNKRIAVIVISSQKDVMLAVNVLKNGAKDYIVKDENTKNLLRLAIMKIKKGIEVKKPARAAFWGVTPLKG